MRETFTVMNSETGKSLQAIDGHRLQGSEGTSNSTLSMGDKHGRLLRWKAGLVALGISNVIAIYLKGQH
jgi:hypothetical protein